jgi:hypothetical protein
MSKKRRSGRSPGYPGRQSRPGPPALVWHEFDDEPVCPHGWEPGDPGVWLPSGVLMDPISDTVMRLLRAWKRVTSDASQCVGPVLVHEGGGFECYGACGADEAAVFRTYHDLNKHLVLCDSRAWDFSIRRPCPRCSR